jgi:DnaJ-class molecular chaperone
MKCEMCEGSGWVILTSLIREGKPVETECPKCEGTGETEGAK